MKRDCRGCLIIYCTLFTRCCSDGSTAVTAVFLKTINKITYFATRVWSGVQSKCTDISNYICSMLKGNAAWNQSHSHWSNGNDSPCSSGQVLALRFACCPDQLCMLAQGVGATKASVHSALLLEMGMWLPKWLAVTALAISEVISELGVELRDLWQGENCWQNLAIGIWVKYFLAVGTSCWLVSHLI